MRKALSVVAVAVPVVAVAAGCTAHPAVPQAVKTLPVATAPAPRAVGTTYIPCTAAELTGRLGPVSMGAGQYYQYLVLTNTGRRACTLTGGPSEISGVRRDGRKVRLATSRASGMSPGFGLLPGPARLRPGRSAQIVIHTGAMCRKALAGRVDDFAALDVGIADRGKVRVGFPRGRAYDAICGIDVSAFGIPKPGF